MDNVLKSGKPQITMTGTPAAVGGPDATCRSSHINTFPAKQWDWQHKVVGGFLNAAMKKYGKKEILKWQFSTWTEPDYPGTSMVLPKRLARSSE